MLDLRGSCLDARLVELSADVELFVHADDAVVERAVAALESIAPLERCADGEYLRAQVRPPEDPQVAAAVESTRGELVRARKRIDAGKAATVTDEVTRLRTRARELEYAPLLAEALLARGRARAEHEQYAAAEPDLDRAFVLGTELGYDDVSAESGPERARAGDRDALVFDDVGFGPAVEGLRASLLRVSRPIELTICSNSESCELVGGVSVSTCPTPPE